jgi:parallel beta-helix repeat protein
MVERYKQRIVLGVVALVAALSLLGGLQGMQAQDAVPAPSSQPADSYVPLPEECDDVTPPGGVPPACCLYGYIYYQDAPLAGVSVRVESAYGAVDLTTAAGLSADDPYYGAPLSGPPLLVSVGDVITLTASYSDMISTRTWTVVNNGQQVDLGLVAGYQAPGALAGASDHTLWKSEASAQQDSSVGYAPMSTETTNALLVTSPADSGPGTLHQALLDALNGDTIAFDPAAFPPSNPASILLTSGPLPDISQGNLTINASNAGVIVDGGLAQDNGFHITSDGNTIKGLQILHFLHNGVVIDSGASDNQIGGIGAGEGNVLSGNGARGIDLHGPGTDDNVVRGNYIGLAADGLTAKGNTWQGIQVYNGAQGNRIEQNVISGNGGNGIALNDSDTMGNTIIGNYIGVDASGALAVANGANGIQVAQGAHGNQIGGSLAGEGNVISGNQWNGIQLIDLGTTENVIVGNYVGADGSGTSAIPNGGSGIRLEGSASQNTVGASNTIAFNGEHGVHVHGNGTISNTITHNSIFSNSQNGIALTDGGNHGLPAPVIIDVNWSDGTVSGTACAHCTIEIYADQDNEGKTFEGQTVTDGAGNFAFDKGAALGGPCLTATATNGPAGNGDTSAFSAPTCGGAGPTPPVAGFVASPTSGSPPLEVQFTDQSSGDIISWDWTLGDGGVSGARHPAHTYVCASPYTVSLTVSGPGGNDAETKGDHIQVTPPDWTFMLYLAGDNDLEYWLERGLHKAESVAGGPHVQIVTLFDGDGYGDTRKYKVRPNGNYVLNVDYWEEGESDMGSPDTLVEFVNWTRDTCPAEHYYLAVSNHGGGTRGIAWEYYRTPGNITRPELETALQGIHAHDPAKIDIVHYDACLMAMTELAYQLKDYADYLVASENLGWSVFAYDLYADAVDDNTTPRDLAAQIADHYSAALAGYPHTISALDLSAMDDLGTTVDGLAESLINGLCTNSMEVYTAWTDTQKLDSRDYFVIDDNDEYLDLASFAQQFTQTADVAVRDAAQVVVNAIGSPGGNLLVAEHHQSGTYHGNYWNLDNTHGLSIYFPPSNEVWGYNDYILSGLPLVNDTHWDEFLQAYFGCITPPPDTGDDPGVPPMIPPSFTVYLPLAIKSP